jgi:transposase
VGECRHHVPDAAAPRLDAEKKSLGASERDEAARAAFRTLIAGLDPRDLVVVDESGSNTAMTLAYAIAPRGHRAYGSVPRNHGRNTTLIAALTLDGIGATMVLEGALCAATFVTFVRDVLGPTLRPGQIVLLDNLSCHKDATARHLVEARGCRVLFLPSYSPDFSPIESAFAKIKAYLRRVAARTTEALLAALAHATTLITAQDAQGFFRHCGYHLEAQSLCNAL